MARTPIKLEARVPASVAVAAATKGLDDAPSPSLPSHAEVETSTAAPRIRLVAPRSAHPKLEPIPAEALEGLGLTLVGMVQIATDAETQVVPVGLAPFAGSDTVDVPTAGFFYDELGRCGILLNGHDGAWQQALPEAVEEARRAFASIPS